MTADAMRVKIAEWMPDVIRYTKDGYVIWGDTGTVVRKREWLQVCHEFEEKMKAAYNPVLSSPQEWDDYRWILIEVVTGNRQFKDGVYIGREVDAINTIDATAAQRCEAFCRMMGWWEE